MGARQQQKLKDRLTTVHSDEPREIRHEVLEILRDHVSSDLGCFFQAVNRDGDFFLTGSVAIGEPALTELADNHLDGPAYSAPWLPDEIDLATVNSFIRVRSYYPERQLLSYHMQTEITRPAGIGDHLRIVVYDGNHIVGWLGLVRQGSQFHRDEQRLLEAVSSQIKAILTGADNLEAKTLDDGLFALFDDDGQLDHASSTFVDWCDDKRSTYLTRRIRDIDAGRGRTGIEVATGAEIRVTRLDATGSVGYLVSVDRPQLLELRPEYRLTDRQCEIAEYACAGATTREIADTLDISPHTVKTHLKNTYQRLGIGSRTELVAMFSQR